MNNVESVAVAVASAKNTKLAALYFDHVVPIYCDDVPKILLPPSFGDWKPTTSTDLLQTIQKATGELRVQVTVPDDNGTERAVRLTDSSGAPDVKAIEYVNQWFFVNRPKLHEKLSKQMRQAMIKDAPVLLSRRFLEGTGSAKTLSDVSATLAGMPIVKVEGASWEQILEFRNDPDSKRRLHLLRLNLTRDYVGRTHSQIEAAIELGIHEHKRAAKKHGFELLVGSMQTACDTKELLGSAGLGAIVGSLIGTPLSATVGALIGVSLDIAKMSLTVAKGTRDLIELRKYHPLSYVIEAQRQLQSDQTRR